MYDCHYDLLTILYYNFKRDNPLANKEKCVRDCEKIYKSGNVIGGIVNLYFLSDDLMKKELGLEKEDFLDVKKMFRRSTNLFNEFKEQKIIDENYKFLFSIENCEYINSPEDLLELYNMGLRSIIISSDTANKYGSGINTENGLTVIGKSLVKLAISLGIIIDVSHANSNTFDDILDIVEESKLKGKNPIVIASHSNPRYSCDRLRNLTDDQIRRLKKVDGYLGLFSLASFVSLGGYNLTTEERKENFVKMLKYVIEELEYPVDKILLSSDDMNFTPDSSYHNNQTFNLDDIAKETKDLLSRHFSDDNVKMLMKDNFEELYRNVNKINCLDLDSNKTNNYKLGEKYE